MALYGSGRGLYGTGYDRLPGAARAMAPTLPGAGRAIQQSLPRMPESEDMPTDEMPLEDMSPDDGTDPSLLRQAADTSLSGLSMVGNALDIPASMVRDVMTWLPGGIAASNPLDQLLSPLSDKNRTSGEDILKNAGLYSQENTNDGMIKSIGKFVGSAALEIGLDPMTYLTLGASAGGKGLKLAKAAGLYDDAVKVASRKSIAQGGEAVGKRRAKQMVTARELAENVSDGVGRDKMVIAYNGSRDVLKGKAPAAASFDDIPAEVLDEALGGNMRWKFPFMDEKIVNDIRLPGGAAIGAGLDALGGLAGSIPLPRTGRTLGDVTPDFIKSIPGALSTGTIDGTKIASAGDAAAEAIRFGKYSPVKALAPFFSRATAGYKTADNQKAAAEILRRVDETSTLARDDAFKGIREAEDKKWFKDTEVKSNPDLPVDKTDWFDTDELLSRAVPTAKTTNLKKLAKVAGVSDRKEWTPADLFNAIKAARETARTTRSTVGPELVDTAYGVKIPKSVARSNAIGDTLETGIPLPKGLEDATEFVDNYRSKVDALDGLNREFATSTPGLSRALPGVFRTVRDADGNPVLSASGVPELVPVEGPIQNYATRVARDIGGVLRKSQTGRNRTDTKDPFSTQREDPYRHLLTSELQILSLDARFAGKYDPSAITNKRKMKDAHEGGTDTGALDGGVVDAAEKEALRTQFFQIYNPLVKPDGTPRYAPEVLADEDAVKGINNLHDQLFEATLTRDRKQVKMGVPMYHVNHAENLLSRLDSGYGTIATTQGVRGMLANYARVRDGSRFAPGGGQAPPPPLVGPTAPPTGPTAPPVGPTAPPTTPPPPPIGPVTPTAPPIAPTSIPPVVPPVSVLPATPTVTLPATVTPTASLPAVTTPSLPPVSVVPPVVKPIIAVPDNPADAILRAANKRLEIARKKYVKFTDDEEAKYLASPAKTLHRGDSKTRARLSEEMRAAEKQVVEARTAIRTPVLPPTSLSKAGVDQPAAIKPTRAVARDVNVIRNTPVEKWSAADVKHVINSKNFASISDNHKTFDTQIKTLVKQKGLRPQDGSILRAIFSQTDLPYMMDAVKASQFLTFDGKFAPPGVSGAAYSVHAKGGTGRVWLRSASDTSEGARDLGTKTMIHEFAHVIWFKAKYSGSDLHKELTDEFKTLSDKQPSKNFLDEFLSGGSSLDNASYYTDGIRGPDKTEIERFAQIMADSLMRRKLPPASKLGKLIDDSMQWLKDKLVQLGAVKGLEPKVRTRIDEIVDELGGFNRPVASELFSNQPSLVKPLMARADGPLEISELAGDVDGVPTPIGQPPQASSLLQSDPSFTDEFAVAAGKTARPWKITTTYREAAKHIKTGDRVLDYGSGSYQEVKKSVTDAGATYVPFDRFPVVGSVDDLAGNDVVMGSNVLNVAVKASDPERAYYAALKEMRAAMKPDGTLVVNMPTSGPLADWMTPARLKKDLESMFNDVKRNKEVMIARAPKSPGQPAIPNSIMGSDGPLGASEMAGDVGGVPTPPAGGAAAVPPASPAKRVYGNSGKNENLLEQMKAMKFDHAEGKAKVIELLGPDAQRMTDTLIDERMTETAAKLQTMFTKAVPGYGMADDELLDTLRNNPDDIADIVAGINDPKIADAAQAAMKSLDAPIDPDDILKEFSLDEEIATDLVRNNRAFSSPEEVSAMTAGFDKVTNLFKGNVTAPFPSFHVRNAMSAMVQNALQGVVDETQTGWRRYAQPYIDAIALIQNKDIKGAADFPMFSGKGLTDAQATEEIRRMEFSRSLTDAPGDHNDLVGNLGGNVADRIVGGSPFKERIKRPAGASVLDTLNPLNSPGLRDSNAYAPVRVGRVVGDMTEQAVRSAPFIALLKQGVDPDEAARQVMRMHVNYGDLTNFERKVMRRAVPFYGFAKGSTKFLTSELAQKPGGSIAQTIKVSENASGNDPGAPSHIRGGFNLPISESPDGTKQYLVGAGLMHEPALQLLGPTVGSTLFNLVGMGHPIPKAIAELATNSSLFQEGTGGGGRSLDDMDPLFGRTASNLVNALPFVEKDTPFRIGKVPEAIIANSPLTRYLSTAKKLTDPRDSLFAKATNFLTGFKVATVDPEDSDAVLREQAEQLMRDLGGRDFSHAYIPDNVMAGLRGSELEKAKQLQELLKMLNNRQRKRKKIKEQAATE